MAEYRKPEIAVLGGAARLIEGIKPHHGDQNDLRNPLPDVEEIND